MPKINNWTLIASEKADYIISESFIEENRYASGKNEEYYERLVPWGTADACVIGISSNGRAEFEGEMIHTSSIKVYGDGYVQTYSGSIYELGEKSDDYLRFEDALKNNVPVVTNWSLGQILSDDYRYFMQGIMTVNEKSYAFIKEVKEQNLEARTIEFADGTKAFMDYYAINPTQMRALRDSLFFLGRKCIYKDEFCDYKTMFIFAKLFIPMCSGAAPAFETDILKYRKDYQRKAPIDDKFRYFIISADDMTKNMTVSERMSVAKEVEA